SLCHPMFIEFVDHFMKLLGALKYLALPGLGIELHFSDNFLCFEVSYSIRLVKIGYRIWQGLASFQEKSWIENSQNQIAKPSSSGSAASFQSPIASSKLFGPSRKYPKGEEVERAAGVELGGDVGGRAGPGLFATGNEHLEIPSVAFGRLFKANGRGPMLEFAAGDRTQ
ncbi:MAG: hypothetical protein WC314_25715, partial [Vulcanimicrobiota bacterium]